MAFLRIKNDLILELDNEHLGRPTQTSQNALHLLK